jgi:hypothetical protein
MAAPAPTPGTAPGPAPARVPGSHACGGAGGFFAWKVERVAQPAAALIAPGWIDIDATGEAADFSYAELNASRAIDAASEIAPGWQGVKGG